MATKRETTEMTPFGFYLSSLLNDRHFGNLTKYSERLHEGGRGASPQMISRYRRSGTPVPLWFVGRTVEVLELTEAEIDKLVDLWLDTLPPGERAVMDSAWKKYSGARGLKDLEDYERQRNEHNGLENGGSSKN